MLRVGAVLMASALVLSGGVAEGSGRADGPPVGVAVAASVEVAVAVSVEAAVSAPADAQWTWPVAGASVARPYLAPATRYASGHRGVDLAASVGAEVVAPTGGIVVFVGRVVDRGVLTLDVGDGRVVTVEPIATSLGVGTVVAAGDPLGAVGVGGHARPGELHLGVRVDGEYVDPMRFFGGTPRAILLPCC